MTYAMTSQHMHLLENCPRYETSHSWGELLWRWCYVVPSIHESHYITAVIQFTTDCLISHAFYTQVKIKIILLDHWTKKPERTIFTISVQQFLHYWHVLHTNSSFLPNFSTNPLISSPNLSLVFNIVLFVTSWSFSPYERQTGWGAVVGGFLYWTCFNSVNQTMVQRYIALPSKRKAIAWVDIIFLY